MHQLEHSPVDWSQIQGSVRERGNYVKWKKPFLASQEMVVADFLKSSFYLFTFTDLSQGLAEI